jgi:hypothetical protein
MLHISQKLSNADDQNKAGCLCAGRRSFQRRVIQNLGILDRVNRP